MTNLYLKPLKLTDVKAEIECRKEVSVAAWRNLFETLKQQRHAAFCDLL
jgi:hypothetical protein